MIRIHINGEPKSIAASLNLKELIGQLGLPEQGVALALNGTVVPKLEWSLNSIDEGDRLDIFQPIAGG